MYISGVWNKVILAALTINLMGLGHTANAAVVLLSEFRSVSANASVSTPVGSDSTSTSRNSLGDFYDFGELVEVDLALANGSASGTAQQTSQVSTTFISASGATTASVEVIAAIDPLTFTFADAHADTSLLVDFEVTTPQLFNLSGAVSLFNPSEINGGIASVSLRSQDGSLIFGTDIFDFQPTPLTIPFDHSGMLLPDIYTLSAGTVIGASAFFATLESGTADFSLDFKVTAVPIPAAAWLFGSGLLGLIGIARRKKET
jgi:hypothetical protein